MRLQNLFEKEVSKDSALVLDYKSISFAAHRYTVYDVKCQFLCQQLKNLNIKLARTARVVSLNRIAFRRRLACILLHKTLHWSNQNPVNSTGILSALVTNHNNKPRCYWAFLLSYYCFVKIYLYTISNLRRYRVLSIFILLLKDYTRNCLSPLANAEHNEIEKYLCR